MADNKITSTERGFFPVASLEAIEKFPLNPYTEFLLYCANSVLPTMEDKYQMSIRDFEAVAKNFDTDDSFLKEMAKKVPGLDLKLGGKDIVSDRQNCVCKFEVYINGRVVGVCHLFRYIPVSDLVNLPENRNGVATMEFRFIDFEGFDFVELPRQDNIFSFCKDENDKGTIDMLLAIFKAMVNFLDYIRAYKAKVLVSKNIKTFAAKFVGPYVSDYFIEFLSDGCHIAVICGENIHKTAFGYDDYLKSIKEFGNTLKEKYGTKYGPQEVLTTENKENNQ